jgi:hypothetical protein
VPEITFTLRARPPFRLDLTVWAIRRRAHNKVDLFDDEVGSGIITVEKVQVLQYGGVKP